MHVNMLYFFSLNLYKLCCCYCVSTTCDLNFRHNNHMNIARERWRITVKLSKLYRIWRVHSKKTLAGFTYLQKSTITMTIRTCACTYGTGTDTCICDVSTRSLLVSQWRPQGETTGTLASLLWNWPLLAPFELHLSISNRLCCCTVR